MRDITTFKFFRNTPLVNFQNTILFKSNKERDNFFLHGGHYPTLNVKDLPFNFVRDRSTIDLPLSIDEVRGVNYCTFLSEFEPSTRYYAFVISVEYLNDNNVRLNLLIDGIMTHCQGDILNNLKNIKVQRQHLTKNLYNYHLWDIKNNDDVLKTHTKSYFAEKNYHFTDFYILFQSSVDLAFKFGTINDPILRTSNGGTFDKITSPVNLYLIDQTDFKELMFNLKDYPWITQNFSSIIMIPKELVKTDDLENVTNEEVPLLTLKRLKNGGSSNLGKINTLSYTPIELMTLFQFDLENDRHLLRNEYTTTEFYTFDGQALFLDNGLLNQTKGIEMMTKSVLGYANEVAFYPNNYKVDDYNLMIPKENTTGAFLNNAITLKGFDEVPILVDNYSLSLAKNANQRTLAESKLITNRLGNLFDPSSDLKSKFFDASSILSNVSFMGLTGRFVDEYEYYREIQAQQKDLALDPGSVTNQTTNNSLSIANNFYGLSLKFSRPDSVEMDRIRKYYKMFGYYLPEENTQLDNVRSMDICNYVQFGGDYNIPNVDVAIMTQISTLFENGVRLWHNKDVPNPFIRNVLDNKLVV